MRCAELRGSRGFRRVGRRTNLALLVLLVGAFGTGWLAFAFGTPAPARLTTMAHGLFGVGVVVLVPWKRLIIARASPLRVLSLGLLSLVLVCLAAGFVEVFGGYGLIAGVSPMQVHVGAALVAVPLFVVHVVRHPRQTPRRVDLSRRNLLRTVAFVAGTCVGYAGLEGIGRLVSRSAARRISTGSHRLGPDNIPATIWLLDRVPSIDPGAHRVDVAGMPYGPAELEERAGLVQARLDCTSGWYADAEWTAVALSDLIPADRLSAAVSIAVVSVTGYRRRFPSAEAGALFLATRCQGQSLVPGTGAPVRLIAPNRRGFWWVKWVASVQLSERPAYAQPPFPTQ